MANVFDQFDAAPAAPAKPAGNPFDQFDAPQDESSWLDTAADVGMSVLSGAGKGLAAVPGIAGDIAGLGDWAANNVSSRVRGVLGLGPRQASEPSPGQAFMPPTTEAIVGGLESAGVEFYEPKTRAGRYAETAAEFVPGAMVGGGSSVRQVVGSGLKYGALPGLASEGAGQATGGTALEPVARAGSAILAGGGAALASRPSNAEAAIGDIVRGVPAAQVRQAALLMQEARAMGAPLTLPEAIQQVTNNGTRAGSLQRVVEQSRGGAAPMAAFMAERPGQVQRVANEMIDGIAPVSAAPSSVAPAVQEAAQGVLTDRRQAINRLAQPFYEGARDVPLDPRSAAALNTNPSYAAARDSALDNPELAPLFQGLDPNSVGAVNEGVKRLDQGVEASRQTAMNPGGDNQLAMVRQRARSEADLAASDASPDYRQARDIVRTGREQLLDPLENGVVGALARSPAFSEQANIILSPNPLPGSAGEVAMAIQQVARRSPEAARQLVSQRLRQVFNEATQNTHSGPNQAGGAKFNAVIRGNGQQAENLRAVVEGLNGPGSWIHFQKTLDVFEAMGRRQAPGSATTFNTQISQELSGGRLVGQAASLAASPTKLAGQAREMYENWRFGRNTEELARLITSPRAPALLRKIAELGPTKAGQSLAAAFLSLNAVRQGGESASGADRLRVTVQP
ncbi:hypothetical protein [Terrihabitans rhizophilus]|uniref:Uncharacterized protein n=1 Tax=Terrihabitans rhizophilus TaxID=3092662 RepID=A0ABU4RSJ3_9HYPH|nr:hypothetical protein [Terrihabitans sp. PJ23]MDX6807163.1 hypothetical protein [Terrihabitans sp. PJ23]